MLSYDNGRDLIVKTLGIITKLVLPFLPEEKFFENSIGKKNMTNYEIKGIPPDWKIRCLSAICSSNVNKHKIHLAAKLVP